MAETISFEPVVYHQAGDTAGHKLVTSDEILQDLAPNRRDSNELATEVVEVSSLVGEKPDGVPDDLWQRYTDVFEEYAICAQAEAGNMDDMAVLAAELTVMQAQVAILHEVDALAAQANDDGMETWLAYKYDQLMELVGTPHESTIADCIAEAEELRARIAEVNELAPDDKRVEQILRAMEREIAQMRVVRDELELAA